MKDKGNDGKGNVPERDLWETQQELWDKLDKEYGFTFDCCSDGKNNKCNSWSSNFEMWVSAGIKHICWMNPPFSISLRMFTHFFKVVDRGVAIYRCDNMETKVWQEVILPNATWVFVLKGRISYTPFDIDMRGGNGTRFPSALIGFNVEPPKEIDGVTLIPNKNVGEK